MFPDQAMDLLIHSFNNISQALTLRWGSGQEQMTETLPLGAPRLPNVT